MQAENSILLSVSEGGRVIDGGRVPVLGLSSVLNFGAGAREPPIHWILPDSIHPTKCQGWLQSKVDGETERIVNQIGSEWSGAGAVREWEWPVWGEDVQLSIMMSQC